MFFGLLKSKQERVLDNTMKDIHENIFPAGETDFLRDIAKISAITN